jgi:hypothetical protein
MTRLLFLAPLPLAELLGCNLLRPFLFVELSTRNTVSAPIDAAISYFFAYWCRRIKDLDPLSKRDNMPERYAFCCVAEISAEVSLHVNLSQLRVIENSDTIGIHKTMNRFSEADKEKKRRRRRLRQVLRIRGQHGQKL